MVRFRAVVTVAAVMAQSFSVLQAGRAGVGAEGRRHLPAAAVANIQTNQSRHNRAGCSLMVYFFANKFSPSSVGPYAPRMTLARRTGCPLTGDDWVQAGFAVLAEDGPNALRIGRLCERLEVTKGSFYWHFTDMRAYRAALADAWANLYDERRRRFESLRHTDPGAGCWR